jgi:hypothetical protein
LFVVKTAKVYISLIFEAYTQVALN